jgi:hypothetical protein
MRPLRFETVRDVCEAFPIAEHELGIVPDDTPPLQFLDSVVEQGELDKAVGLCAYLLPRREAVWWGCRAVKAIIPHRTRDEDQAIAVAERWVLEPEEDLRTAALQFGMKASPRLPATWLALAAGWSGGTRFVDAGTVVPTQPHQTAQAVRTAVLIASCRRPMSEKPEVLRRCVADGIGIATNAPGVN